VWNISLWRIGIHGICCKPTIEDGRAANTRGKKGDLLATLNESLESFDIVGVDRTQVTLIKGLFQNTLASSIDLVKPIAVLRLDGDWYESTKVCLETLYAHVIIGGRIIIDDYGHWEGCRKAVDEFLSANALKPKLISTDYTERWWIKE
jgi:O-methyltransferase